MYFSFAFMTNNKTVKPKTKQWYPRKRISMTAPWKRWSDIQQSATGCAIARYKHLCAQCHHYQVPFSTCKVSAIMGVMDGEIEGVRGRERGREGEGQGRRE